MASGLRAGTAWYGMRPPAADDGIKANYPDKSDPAATAAGSGSRARRRRRHQGGSGTARIVGAT